MTASPQPIPTEVRGVQFRSRLEGRWGLLFDELSIRYEYEAEGYNLDGTWYIPDFWLPDLKRWAELKPDSDMPEPERIYMTGLSADQRGRLHLAYHSSCGADTGKQQEPEDRASACIREMDRSTGLFAWLDSIDCHGPLVEIGVAQGRGKPVWVAMNSAIRSPQVMDAFSLAFALSGKRGSFSSPQAALNEWLPDYSEAMKKCLRLSSAYPVDLFYGQPFDGVCCMFQQERCQGFRKPTQVLAFDYRGGSVEKVERAAVTVRNHRFW